MTSGSEVTSVINGARRAWIYAFLVFIFGSAAGLIVLNGPLLELRDYLLWNRKVPLNQKVGDGIIRAIEAYKLRSGILPEALSDLVPGYLAEVPPTGIGSGEWEYKTYSGASYNLSFACKRKYPVAVYSSDTRSWYVDQ